MITRWYTGRNQIFMQPSGYVPWKMSVSLLCVLSSIRLDDGDDVDSGMTLKNMLTRPELCGICPSPRLPHLFTPFASARDTFLSLPSDSLRSDFASEPLARVESCRCAHINANVIHRRGIRPDSKKFYKFWVGCNPSHGIARGNMICEDWSALDHPGWFHLALINGKDRRMRSRISDSAWWGYLNAQKMRNQGILRNSTGIIKRGKKR